MDRLEFLMQKLINGESLDNWNSLNRLEEYLVVCINKEDPSKLGKPLNRYEELLSMLAKALIGTKSDTKIISPEGDVILVGEYDGSKISTNEQGTFNLKDLIINSKKIPLTIDVEVQPFYVDSDIDGNVVLKSTTKTKGVLSDNQGNVKIL